jgi:hypothetical protein
VEDLETAKAKSERIQKGFATVKEKLLAKNPDVIIVIGDDQGENFNFNNFPGMAVYVGEEFEGALATTQRREPGMGGQGQGGQGQGQGGGAPRGEAGAPRAKVQGHPGLAVGVLTGLMKRGFDPAFCMDLPTPERGIGHAVMRPYQSITDQKTPIVPVLLNCYYAPQVTGMRAYQLGKAIREAIEEYPEDIKVAVVGSGGLWHTPGAMNAYLDEDFDQKTLSLMAAGDIRGMAEHFDAYHVAEGDLSQPVGERGRGSTGMPSFGGPQGGTRETCNWIAASAVADGSQATVVDYVPVYSSPVGAAFSYVENP